MNRLCKICKKNEKENKEKLTVHHIDYNKKNSKKSNLVALCRSCHTKTGFNREYWKCYFSGLQYRREPL